MSVTSPAPTGCAPAAAPHPRAADWLRTFQQGLLDDVVPFWMRYGVDRRCGGYLHCLERDGRVFCTDKTVALQARMAWVYARLFNRVEPRAEWLDLARHGLRFLSDCGSDRLGRVYHFVTREGRPLRRAGNLEGLGFAAMAYAETSLATGEGALGLRAARLQRRLVRAIRSFESRPRPLRAFRKLSLRFLLAQSAPNLQRLDPAGDHGALARRCLTEALDDFRFGELLVERLDRRGRPVGRLEDERFCPGHNVEVAWFAMDEARRSGDSALLGKALALLEAALENGWDEAAGGVFLHTDVHGRPFAGEGARKLWWPQVEALVATLLAYVLTADPLWEGWFDRLRDYAFERFPDPLCGEWFGYLDRDGTPLPGVARVLDGGSARTEIKGDLQKTGFHLVRALLACWCLLDSLKTGEALPEALR